MRAVNVGPYIAAQLGGAVTGVGLSHLCFPREALAAIEMATPYVREGLGWQLGLGTEIATTFLLVFVIYGTAVDLRSPRLAGLYIGLAVTVAILIGGPVSGASMNPARYLGPALFGRGLDEAWLYLAGPLLGGLAAAQFYRHGLRLPANR
jgi:aquaporin Z